MACNTKKQKTGGWQKNKFYDQVASEIQQQTMVAGLWTRAYAEMNGDEAKARALYIRYRVQQLSENSPEQAEKKQPVRNINLGVFASILGFITLLGAGLVVFSVIGLLTATSDNAFGYIGGFVFGCLVAYVSGWMAFKCIKSE